MANIKLDKLEDALKKELTLYQDDINTSVREAVKVNMRAMVKETKAQRFKEDTGNYRKAIASRPGIRTPNTLSMIWYVKAPHYRLSHLLEYGHATRNGGRTVAYGFISKAEDTAITNLEKDITEAIKNVK